jgi:opacity protein-like surface antigen
MKRFFLLSLLVTSISFVFAQGNINKGDWLVGGDIDFSSNKFKSSTSRTTDISFSPSLAYFFANQLAGGVSVNLGSSKSGSGNNEYKSTNNFFLPFVRYYFLPSTKSVNLFADAGYGFGRYKNTTGSTTSSEGSYNGFDLMAGVSSFVTPSVALRFGVGYGSFNYDNDDEYNEVYVTIGFNIHLPGSRSRARTTSTNQ